MNRECGQSVLEYVNSIPGLRDDILASDDFEYNSEKYNQYLYEGCATIKTQEGWESLELDWYNSGTTKLVLHFRNDALRDYVFKIPFHGRYSKETFSGANTGTYTVEDFHARVNCWDYCAREEYMYNAATDFVRSLLVETRFLCSDNYFRIYASELVEETHIDWHRPNHNTHCLDDIFEQVSLDCDKDTWEVAEKVNDNVAQEVLNSYWGSDEIYEFLVFCSVNEINDIHRENIGLQNNRLVCLDYSGYFS